LALGPQLDKSAGAGPLGSDKLDDAQRVMLYDASKKSVAAAYILWILLGHFGAHRFYLGKTTSATVMLILALLAIPLCFVLIGYLILPIVWLWMLIDLFLIPGLTRDHNLHMAMAYGR
jgi:TM2 domain-containing membrane protein YozV